MTVAPNSESLRIIYRWINDLTVIAPLTQEDNPITDDTLRLYTEMLARDYPSTAFNIESLHHVAHGHGKPFFPAYATISRLVGEHWRENRPHTAPLITGPQGQGLTAMDRTWLAYWHKRRPELSAYEDRHAEQLAGGDPWQRPLAMLASLVREKSPAAWHVIMAGEIGNVVPFPEKSRAEP